MEIKKLRDLMEDNDLHQKDVAKYLGLTQQQYSLYKKGIRDLPIELLIKSAHFYEVSANYILNIDNKKIRN